MPRAIRMKYTFVLCLCAVLFGGCSSGFIGARGGAVVTLAGGKETGPVANSTNRIGSVYGVTVGGRFNEKIGLQADATIRSHTIVQEVRTAFYQNGSYLFDGTVETSADIVEVPVMLILSKPVNTNFRPLIGIGSHLGFRTSLSGTIKGTITKIEGEGAGQTAPMSEKVVASNPSDDPIIGVSAIVGGDYRLSEDWCVRGELRFQHDILNDGPTGFQLGRSSSNSVVTSELPPTRLSVAVSLVFAL